MQHKGRSSGPRALRILITHDTAASGSGLYVLDLARALLRKGHKPVVYTTVLDAVAGSLREATVPVIDDLAALDAAPDVIHGQHHLETMTAALHFAGTPVVACSHGWMPWEDTPSVFPTIARWIAIDDLCAERLATTRGVDRTRVRTLYDAVDIARFPPRDALPATPRRALVFSGHGVQDAFAATILRACRQAGIAVDIASPGQASDALRDYDVVFATARDALEAMAVGCATVVADRGGFAGLVTTANFDRLRALNFGARSLQAGPVTEAAVLAAIGDYDVGDASRVSQRVRTEANFDTLADAMLVQYREAIDAGRVPDPVDCTQAAARYLRDTLSPMVKSVEQANQARHAAETARDAEAENAEAAALAAEKRIDAALRAREAAMTERAVALKAHDDMEVRLERALQRSLDAGIERDAAFAAREDAKDAQLIATLAQARTAEALADALRAQAQLALDLADALRAQGQLSADVADAQDRLAKVQAELDAQRQAQSEARRSKGWRATLATYRRLWAKFA
jgi:hypothetical protein